MTPGSGRFRWRRKWQPTPVFLPGESHGQRSLVGYSPGGCKESDTTERLTHTDTHKCMCTLIHRHTMIEMQPDQNQLPARGGRAAGKATRTPHTSGPRGNARCLAPICILKTRPDKRLNFLNTFPPDGSLPVPALVGSPPGACQDAGGGPLLILFHSK